MQQLASVEEATLDNQEELTPIKIDIYFLLLLSPTTWSRVLFALLFPYYHIVVVLLFPSKRWFAYHSTMVKAME